MSCSAVLRKFLFTHGRLVGEGEGDRPARVPLYAYRCTDQAYKELQSQVSEDLAAALSGRPPMAFEACFCLYAAETFRREHSGGPWAWRTVFDPLGTEVPPNPVIGRWVEKGLGYWGRDVARGEGGQRLSLVTIACEGGLPLRLLQNEGANLRTFFRRILESHHEGRGIAADMANLARLQLRYLPKSLRNEEVVRLAADLMRRTVDLQRIVGDAADPIAVLDDEVPKWRSTLPLRMDDDIAAALFKNLVEQSRELAEAASARPAWIGELVQERPGEYLVQKRLRFPDRIAQAALAALAGRVLRTSPRVRLMLTTSDTSEPVANLTLFAHGQGDLLYRREWLSRDGLVLGVPTLLDLHSLQLHDGSSILDIPLENADPWGESPWVFLPTREEQHWEWLTEGSAYTRGEQVMVVVSSDCKPLHADTGVWEHLGKIAGLNRNVYSVAGTVNFSTEEGDRYQIVCSASYDSRQSLSLTGQRQPLILNRNPVFRGFPRFIETSPEGVSMNAEGTIEWRPLAERGGWRSVRDGCLGRVWLRLVDSATNVERVRRKVDVLPRDFELERHIGTQKQGGRYRFSGLSQAEIRVSSSHSNEIVSHDGEIADVEFEAVSGREITPISVQLSWPGRHAVPLELPYPQQGAVFMLDGRSLAVDELVALDRLYGLWLMLQNPTGGARFMLDAELLATHTQGKAGSKLGLTNQLPPLQDGGLEVNLGPWVDQVKSLLAAREDPEARVRLTVQSRSGEILARVLVARYDMEIHPRVGTATVYLPQVQCEKLGGALESRVTLEMFPLWLPDQAPCPLESVPGVPGSWQVPWGLAPGPWWIVGRDGQWSRFRPLLWTVRDDGDWKGEMTVGCALAEAVREPDHGLRELAIDTILAEMGNVPDRPDWDLFLAYVAQAAEFPPNSLDVLRQVVRHPSTLAMALLRSDEDQFAHMWSLAEEMPFAWGLIPISDWRYATQIYFEHLRESLSEIEGGELILWDAFQGFRERGASMRSYFQPLCDWLQELIFPDRPLGQSVFQVARALQMSFITERVQAEEMELLARHEADERWPHGDDVMREADSGLLSADFLSATKPAFQRPVRCAPFVAVAVAMDGRVPSDNLVYDLRVLRSFDPDWFDNAYMFGLAMALAQGNWEGTL